MKALNLFRGNLSKSVMELMESDPEIKEQLERLQLMVIKKYMSLSKQ
jgi:hypothetical protein